MTKSSARKPTTLLATIALVFLAILITVMPPVQAAPLPTGLAKRGAVGKSVASTLAPTQLLTDTAGQGIQAQASQARGALGDADATLTKEVGRINSSGEQTLVGGSTTLMQTPGVVGKVLGDSPV
ncbi:hypothetical protein BGX29_003431 [Mortierella sp. GBA35]|nr:hypothetical protein BGX23_004151 [Mortierella sp. AD031]KAF9103389.1 hypothetical protein BGX29_003431 [Mortierella sp. GBA35]KAG0219844.1 hypothetical protein BGX33_000145 [Mortierella sp. NVP41]